MANSSISSFVNSVQGRGNLLFRIAKDVLSPVVVAPLRDKVLPQLVSGLAVAWKTECNPARAIWRTSASCPMVSRVSPGLPIRKNPNARMHTASSAVSFWHLFQRDSLVHAVQHLLIARLDPKINTAASGGRHLADQFLIHRIDPVDRPRGCPACDAASPGRCPRPACD